MAKRKLKEKEEEVIKKKPGKPGKPKDKPKPGKPKPGKPGRPPKDKPKPGKPGKPGKPKDKPKPGKPKPKPKRTPDKVRSLAAIKAAKKMSKKKKIARAKLAWKTRRKLYGKTGTRKK